MTRSGPLSSTIIADLIFAGESVEPKLGALRQEFERTSIIVVSMARGRRHDRADHGAGVDEFHQHERAAQCAVGYRIRKGRAKRHSARSARQPHDGARRCQYFADAATRARSGVTNGLRVLLVKDDRDVLSATALLLQKWGPGSGGTSTATKRGEWDVLITDFDLGEHQTGSD
ncbi:hypothetical protein FHS76_004175 [Ochrobactrum daejeonense]|uniref:Uncharacterized protein n=1 Tax=Brucella daejeonensis TaxID=659015 RepID=A0A7W9B104_9HYPH|nr:hypothetical protein [Brucella daejeonensis]MBB5704258.1 hypothetical protein [Brucella daejeonensis]